MHWKPICKLFSLRKSCTLTGDLFASTALMNAMMPLRPQQHIAKMDLFTLTALIMDNSRLIVRDVANLELGTEDILRPQVVGNVMV